VLRNLVRANGPGTSVQTERAATRRSTCSITLPRCGSILFLSTPGASPRALPLAKLCRTFSALKFGSLITSDLVCYADPYLSDARARAFAASVSRSRGGAFDTNDRINSVAAALTCSIARSNTSSFALDGFVNPLSFRTNCSDDAWISSAVAGGSKLWRVLIFLHIILILLLPSACVMISSKCPYRSWAKTKWYSHHSATPRSVRCRP